MLRSLQPSETGPPEHLYLNPSPKEAGTFPAVWFIPQKASQIHQGVPGCPGVCCCQACSCKWNPICLSVCSCFSGRAGLSSAPDKTPLTQFPVSGRFFPDGFSLPAFLSSGLQFKPEAIRHFLRWDPNREGSQLASPTPHGPTERMVLRKMSVVSSLRGSRGRAPGRHSKRCHFLCSALPLNGRARQPHLTAHKGFLSNATFHFYEPVEHVSLYTMIRRSETASHI